MMVKILLAEDHIIIPHSLKMLLQELVDNAEITYAGDTASAMQEIKTNNYFMVILAMDISETDTITLVTEIMMLQPETKLLVFSDNSGLVLARKILQLGAMGFLNEKTSKHEIERAIKSILDNRRFVSSPLLQVLARDILEKRAANAFLSLTRREFEIIKFFLTGQSVPDISARTGLHTSTISTYKTRILEKLSCKDMTDAAVLARLYDIY